MSAAKGSGIWGGRFKQGTAQLVADYTESVSFDHRLYRQDIAGSKAHARMLGRQGVITEEEAARLCTGLDQVLQEIDSGTFVWNQALEDVHMNIESRLTEIIGETGKKLHTGRSRNDQVALDFRLFVSERLGSWQIHLRDLTRVLAGQASGHARVLLPGYTHLQPAQPVSLGQHLLAYASMFMRDADRLSDAQKRVRVSPLGAAALAGTTYPSDPGWVASELDLDRVFQNSMDAVSDRDFALEGLFCASLIMMHLSRLCEDIILWANPSFGFVRLPDEYSTGSSIMPQKKNPDVAELMRGKTGRVYGSLISLLTTMKGLPMTYNRDLQEDKEPFFEADRVVGMSLQVMAGMLEKLVFVPERMAEAMKSGYINATELADYLVGKGIPFRQAHHFTGEVVALAESRGVALEDLPLEAMQGICPDIGQDVFAVLPYEAAVARRLTPGGTGPASITAQLEAVLRWVNQPEI